MRQFNDILLNAADASTSKNSNPLFLEQMYGFAVQAVFTGSPVGSAKLQGSNDEGSTSNALTSQGQGITTWIDIASSTQAVSGAGALMWDVQAAFYRWVRVVYTASSGTGTITVTGNAKGV